MFEPATVSLEAALEAETRSLGVGVTTESWHPEPGCTIVVAGSTRWDRPSTEKARVLRSPHIPLASAAASLEALGAAAPTAGLYHAWYRVHPCGQHDGVSGG